MVYPDAIFMRLEGVARVGFAKYFEELKLNDQLETANTILIDRIETLVPVALKLVNDVLYERNIEAFHTAWNLDQLIRNYCKG